MITTEYYTLTVYGINQLKLKSIKCFSSHLITSEL